jgi:site-specific DNA recombinase
MAGRLRPVPDTPPRAVLYLRQSISHDDSVSLELQEAAGRDYCAREGYQVVAVLADPGISGRTWKRPAVVRTLEMIETGEADVVVLWKWSRLSRSRRDWALAADRADVAGGRIESSTESVDIGTATGRLTRGMLVELAAFESDRIGEVWKEVHKSRLSRGLVPNGNPRYGYVWDRDADMHVPHPVDGPALREAYERYVAGESFYAIVQWLNRRGLRTTNDSPWSSRILISVMDRGFGAGQIVWGNQTVAGAHEAVVPPDLWQAYLDRREANRSVAPRSKSSKYLLSGMVKCAQCGGPMSGGASPQGPRFRCNRNRDHGQAPDTGCTGGYVQMHVVETAVFDWLQEHVANVEAVAAAAERTSATKVSADADARRAAQSVTRVDEQLKRLTLQMTEGLVPDDVYVSVRDELLEQRAGFEAQLEESGRLSRRAAVDTIEVAEGLIEGWRHLQVSVRRTMLGVLIERVEVATSRAKGAGTGNGGVSRATVVIVPR